ncbi:hypothetical protein CL619_03955 [archaeon]|nr:hypothetical protein [archaeon]
MNKIAGEPHLEYMYSYISNDDALSGNFERQYDFIRGWNPLSALEEVLVYQPPESGAYLVEIIDFKQKGRPVVAKYDPHGFTEPIDE